MDILSVLKIVQISDSLFPIGAFTQSNGLETMVSRETVKTDKDLKDYLKTYMAILPYNDLGVMLLAYKNCSDWKYIVELDRLSMALKSPHEVREGNAKLCRRFLKLWDNVKKHQLLDRYSSAIKEGSMIGNHSIAVGMYAWENDICAELAGAVYAYSLINMIITNAVKTVPLSQISGQKILYQALEKIDGCIRESMKITDKDLGIGGVGLDIAGMQHEELYSRVYMS